MKAVGYVRVSTDEQHNSPAAQRDQIEAYCRMKGLDLIELVDANGGESGGLPMAKREGGKRLLAAIKEETGHGEMIAVVAVKLDRLFRDASDCLETVRRWDGIGAELHIIDLGGASINTAKANGRFMLTVLAAAAEMERNLIRERTREALQKKRRKGECVGTVPYGFRRKGKKLLKDKLEQRRIEFMIQLRDRGYSYQRIASKLNEFGFRPRSKSGTWHASTVRTILTREEIPAV